MGGPRGVKQLNTTVVFMWFWKEQLYNKSVDFLLTLVLGVSAVTCCNFKFTYSLSRVSKSTVVRSLVIGWSLALMSERVIFCYFVWFIYHISLPLFITCCDKHACISVACMNCGADWVLQFTAIQSMPYTSRSDQVTSQCQGSRDYHPSQCK